MTQRFPAGRLAVRALAAAVLTAGLFALAPPSHAQGSLISPAGQPRVTAPGGLRGRAALRAKHKARHPIIRRHRR